MTLGEIESFSNISYFILLTIIVLVAVQLVVVLIL
jgi:hypothetical protein